MLAQADFQRALALALGELAPAWTIVGECSPVDRLDASHWGSGPQSFQVTLRHRVTGHLKVLGRRTSYEPTASLHPAVARSLIGGPRGAAGAQPVTRRTRGADSRSSKADARTAQARAGDLVLAPRRERPGQVARTGLSRARRPQETAPPACVARYLWKASKISPNSSQYSPLNLASRSCWMGA